MSNKSYKNCTDKELLKLPKCRHLNRRLNVTWRQCYSKMSPSRLKFKCELKITYISLLSTAYKCANII